MKNSSVHQRSRRAFTLVELLVVIAIIAILAALLLPVLGIVKTKAKVKQAQLEMSAMVQAIDSYRSQYSRYPASPTAMTAAANHKEDFTCGTFNVTNVNFMVLNPAPFGANENTNNAEVIAVLMDMDNYPNGVATINKNHVKNPQQIKFLTARMAQDQDSPGVGPDGVYRDPWGNPYIISMDLSYDDKCMDAIYRTSNLSSQGSQAGINGLFNSIDSTSDNFAFNGGVMIWSLGPDKRFEPTAKANASYNKDNVLSWKQ